MLGERDRVARRAKQIATTQPQPLTLAYPTAAAAAADSPTPCIPNENALQQFDSGMPQATLSHDSRNPLAATPETL